MLPLVPREVNKELIVFDDVVGYRWCRANVETAAEFGPLVPGSLILDFMLWDLPLPVGPIPGSGLHRDCVGFLKE